MGGSSTASAPSSPMVPTTARAEIRKRQNRDSARRSREKRKSHLRGVAESVEMQSRRVRELDARVAQLEALVHKAVKHPTTGSAAASQQQQQGRTRNNSGHNNTARRMHAQNTPPPNNTSTRNMHQIQQQQSIQAQAHPHLPHPIPAMPAAPVAPFYSAAIAATGTTPNLNSAQPSATLPHPVSGANAASFLPSSLLGCIPPVTPNNNALPISVSTPFASSHPPQSALAFALDPWPLPPEPLVSSGNAAVSAAAVVATSPMLSSTSPIGHGHHATNALDPYMGDV